MYKMSTKMCSLNRYVLLWEPTKSSRTELTKQTWESMVNSHKTEIYRFGYANKLVAHHSHHNFPLSLFNYLLFTILHEFFIFSPNKTFLNLITFFPISFTFFFFTTHYYYTLSPTPTKITSIPLIFTILVAKSTQFQTSLQIWVFNLTLPK